MSAVLTEVVQKKPIAVCLVSCGSKIALVKSRNGWQLPGGKLEEGESAAHAVVRELGEELGKALCDSLPPVSKVGQRELHTPTTTRTAHYFASETPVLHRLRPKNPREIEKAVWIEAKDARAYLGDDIFQPIAERIDEIAARRGRVRSEPGGDVPRRG